MDQFNVLALAKLNLDQIILRYSYSRSEATEEVLSRGYSYSRSEATDELLSRLSSGRERSDQRSPIRRLYACADQVLHQNL